MGWRGVGSLLVPRRGLARRSPCILLAYFFHTCLRIFKIGVNICNVLERQVAREGTHKKSLGNDRGPSKVSVMTS